LSRVALAKRAARAVSFVAAAAALFGCGPQVPALLDGHHYREATCAATEGAGAPNDVTTAMTRALDPQMHVEVVSDTTLSGAVPEATREMRERALVVRVRLMTNDIPIDHLALALATTGDVSARPMEMNALAGLTGERIPPSHTVTESHTIENIFRAGVAVFSAGLLDPGQRGDTTRVEPPSTEEWKAAAPIASHIFESFPSPGCDERRSGDDEAPRVGASCEATLLVEPRAGGELALDLDLLYTADRLARTHDLRGPEDAWKCRLKERIRIPLGPVATLASNTSATFGARYRSATEVGRPRAE
jgi:hypothetical protein